jgi:hypothetical protein
MRALTLGGSTEATSDAVTPVVDMVGGDKSASNFDSWNER